MSYFSVVNQQTNKQINKLTLKTTTHQLVHFARHHNCFDRLILPEPSCHNVVSARQHYVSGTVYLTSYDPAVPWIHLFSVAFDA